MLTAACPAHRAGHGPHLRDKLARVKGIALAADIPRNVLKPRFVRNREGRIGLGRYFEIIVDSRLALIGQQQFACRTRVQRVARAFVHCNANFLRAQGQCRHAARAAAGDVQFHRLPALQGKLFQHGARKLFQARLLLFPVHKALFKQRAGGVQLCLLIFAQIAAVHKFRQ